MDAPNSRPSQPVQRMATERREHAESDSDSDTDSSQPQLAGATMQREPSQAGHGKSSPLRSGAQQVISQLQTCTPEELAQISRVLQTFQARLSAQATTTGRQWTGSSEPLQKETDRSQTQRPLSEISGHGRRQQSPNTQIAAGPTAPQKQQMRQTPQQLPVGGPIVRSAEPYDRKSPIVFRGRPRQQLPSPVMYSSPPNPRGADDNSNLALPPYYNLSGGRGRQPPPTPRSIASPPHMQLPQRPQIYAGFQGGGLDVNTSLRTGKMAVQSTEETGRLPLQPFRPQAATGVEVVMQRMPQERPQPLLDPPGITVGAQGDKYSPTLEPDYRVRTASFFNVGRVFLVLWTEPAGSTSRSRTSYSPDVFLAAFGERAFSKVRRFVVVRTALRYSICVAIVTHSGRGDMKPGIDGREYGSVYTGSKPPANQGTSRESLPPIRVDPDGRQALLNPLSRIDFGRLYTVEHNVKVKPFGVVNRSDLPTLLLNCKMVHPPSVPSLEQGKNASQLKLQPEVGDESEDQDDSDDEETDDDDDDDDDDHDHDNANGDKEGKGSGASKQAEKSKSLINWDIGDQKKPALV